MRIVVIGTSGAGKSTLARHIAAHLGLPHIELDAINWQAGWRDLNRHDPPEFVRRVDEAIRADAWVVDGNYGLVRDTVWRRATHLIWLDYNRPLIMARVIRRSLLRAVLRTELWAGNRERWRHMLRRAIRSAGPGAIGPGTAASMRRGCGAKNTSASSFCGFAARRRRSAQSSFWRKRGTHRVAEKL